MKGIYKFTNNINGKVYIGQSINLEKRYGEHKRGHVNSNYSNYDTKFYRALRKYGFDNFSYEILEQSNDFTFEELNKLEVEYIDYYNSYNNGYNTQPGGDNCGTPRVLDVDKVLQIKDRIVNTKDLFSEIAKEYSVEESLITMINNGKVWNWIGNTDFPLRKNASSIAASGENNSRAKFTNKEIIEIRLMFVNHTLPEIYDIYKDRCSFHEMKKICYGVQFKSLPVYKKREKQWYLQGACIDYPRLEEY